MSSKSRYTKKLARRICDEIAQGNTFAKVARLEGMPTERTIRRWLEIGKGGREDFRKMYMQVMTDKCFSVVDELDNLSRKEAVPTIEEVYRNHPTLTESEIKSQFSAEIQQHKVRIDVLKTILTKVSAKLVPELADKKTLKLEGEALNTGTVYNIVNYADAVIEKPVNPAIEDDSDA